MEAPVLFQCPISMEMMEDPVTVATGVTYDRKSIEKWLFTYKKSTCPATMQMLHTFDLTPNHTLKRLISSFMENSAADQEAPANSAAASCSRPSSSGEPQHGELEALLSRVETSPFKASCLKKLRVLIEKREKLQRDLIASGGVEVLGRIVFAASASASTENSDFAAFQACEEALGVLCLLPVTDAPTAALLQKPEFIRPMMAVLRRGSAEARLHAMVILMKMAQINKTVADRDAGDAIVSLLEVLSDEISISTKLSSSSLDVLLELVAAGKKNRLRAVEAGAVRVLAELLPEANRHNCEKALLLLKRLCQCPEGRAALVEHALGVAVVSKKILRVSETATKLGVKILFLMSNHLATEKVLEDMMVFGSVKKLLVLLHTEARSSTKEKAMKMMKLHGGLWRQHACFPSELKDFLRFTC